MNFLYQNFINKHNRLLEKLCVYKKHYLENFIPCLSKSLHAFPMHTCGKLKMLNLLNLQYKMFSTTTITG